jgi:predicted RNA binding protein YcfA (HicA-like mRNA interferase family)
MPHYGPIKRRNLIRALRKAGFTGPFGKSVKRGGKVHEIMLSALGGRLTIPNPHGGDIGIGLLSVVLKEASITREQWEQL